MSASLNLTDAAALRAYMETFSPDVMSILFHSPKTLSLIHPHEGIKGDLILTELEVGDLVQKWTKSFDPTADAFKFSPEILTVKPLKVDTQIYPQEFEQSYLAFARRKGFSSVTDLPFEGFILQKKLKKIMQEMEVAVWKAVAGAGTTLLTQFDGFLEIIADLITATTLTPVATGAIDNTNAVDSFELMWDFLLDAYKEDETTFFCNNTIMQYYLRDYRKRHGFGLMPAVDGPSTRVKLDFGNAYIQAVPGLTGSGRVVLCRAMDTLHYGYDAPEDINTIKFQDDHRAIDMMMDFKFGVQAGLKKDQVIVVNDQA